MSKHQDYVQKTEALVEPILQKHQFELVDVEFVKEAGSWHLRVYIDKEGGITIDDLTLVNHELSDEMDKDDFIEESYILEVSSPGLLRPFKLFSPVTWEEKGKKYSAKEFVGVLKEYREDTETIVLSMDDREMETPVKEIALIRKYITF